MPEERLINKMKKYNISFIGIDNGVSGTIGAICMKGYSSDFFFEKTPVRSEQNYTKTKGNITRIDVKKLYYQLKQFEADQIIVRIERPMVNPGRFKATISAIRALEATLIVLEKLKWGYQYIDSKEWQKALLPHGIKGGPAQKKASLDIGKRLYPQFSQLIGKHKDADGLLMAHYLMKLEQGLVK